MEDYHNILYWNWFQHKMDVSGMVYRFDALCIVRYILNRIPILIYLNYRFNLTNSEEPYFLVESLEALHSLDGNEDRLFRVVIYSVNQKGRSPKVVLKDLLIGDRDHHSACKDFGFSILFILSTSVCLSILFLGFIFSYQKR